MIVVVDNHDSFTYNLVQLLAELGARVVVLQNDATDVHAIRAMTPEGILLSPGPGRPEKAGVTPEVIRAFAGEVPLLGVCLGHQAIGHVYGGAVVRARTLMHGRTSEVFHEGKGMFAGIPSPFTVARYHSLVVERASLPESLEVTAWTEDGEIMGLAHRALEVEGVQFHPESFLTTHGHALLARFLDRLPSRGKARAPRPIMEWGEERA